MLKKITLTAILAFALTSLLGQEFKPSKTQFMIRGYAHSGWDYLKIGDEVQSTYDGATFAPIFLFKHGKRLLFESELEFQLKGNEVEIGFEYSNMSYIVNRYLTVRGGKFLLPFGTFMERLHPSWINRFSTRPLGFGHGGIAPSSGVGLELRGSAPIGGSKINYAFYGVNGPRLVTGVDEPDEAGTLSFNNFVDNNNKRAYGGRVGWLPFINSSVEIGVSAYVTSQTADRNDSLYQGVGAQLYAVDFSYVEQLRPLGGIIDLKAQYNVNNVDQATYFETHPGDSIATPYTFENKSNSYYVQLSYRPTMAGGTFVKNLELAGRYSALSTPEGSLWEEQSTQVAIALNYWISWRNVLKFSYQVTNSVGGHEAGGGTLKSSGFYAHWAIGF